jgi:cbb3-type cytochrome oxidase maturation protein
MDITFYLFFMALLVSLAAWCIFLWGIRTGQFHEVEDVKYQVWPKAVEPDVQEGSTRPEAPRSAPESRGR